MKKSVLFFLALASGLVFGDVVVPRPTKVTTVELFDEDASALYEVLDGSLERNVPGPRGSVLTYKLFRAPSGETQIYCSGSRAVEEAGVSDVSCTIENGNGRPLPVKTIPRIRG